MGVLTETTFEQRKRALDRIITDCTRGLDAIDGPLALSYLLWPDAADIPLQHLPSPVEHSYSSVQLCWAVGCGEPVEQGLCPACRILFEMGEAIDFDWVRA